MTARIKFVDKQNVVFKEIDVSLACTDLAVYKSGTFYTLGGGANSNIYDSIDFSSLYYIDNLIALPNLTRVYVGGYEEKDTYGKETLKQLIEWPNVYELFQNVKNFAFPNYALQGIVIRDAVFPMKMCYFLSHLNADFFKSCLIAKLRWNLAELCVSMNTMELPDYVLLWISDYTPYMATLISESEKIDLIRTIRGKERN